MQVFQRFLGIADFLCNFGNNEDTDHLLMACREAAAFRKLCYRLNGEVRGHSPVSAKEYAQHGDHTGILQIREAEEDEPESCRRLLHHDVTCDEQGTDLGVLAEENEQDVDGECNQEHHHHHGERTANVLNGHLCSCLPEIRVDNSSGKLKTILQAREHRTEVSDQAAGCDVQDHVTDSTFDETSQAFIPWLSKQCITNEYDEADEEERLRQDVILEKFPDWHQDFHMIYPPNDELCI